MSDQKAFCFCTGELVDCIPGRVQDCNMKNVSVCPLADEIAQRKIKEPQETQGKAKTEKQKTDRKSNDTVKKKIEKPFCFCKGELVDCIPGRVQDCNMKNVSKCPLEEGRAGQEAKKQSNIKKENPQSQEKNEKSKDKKESKEEKKTKEITKGFCFCKGELVDCIPGRVQDCNMKNVSKCPLEEEKAGQKPEKQSEKQKAFCFCKGELVDCIPGRVQDCNMKNVSKCPLGK